MPLALVLTCALVHAQEAPKPLYDPDSPQAMAAREKVQAESKAWSAEAEALTPSALFKVLERLDEAHDAKLMLDPGKYWLGSDESFKSSIMASVLTKRAKHDPAAAFFEGAHQWKLCVKLQGVTGESWRRAANECWQSSLTAFKAASEAEIGDASFNIARQYENGHGVTASKLVASGWYVKAAEQYNKRKDRDEALTAIEKALDLVPDHPAALRLRKAMLR